MTHLRQLVLPSLCTLLVLTVACSDDPDPASNSGADGAADGGATDTGTSSGGSDASSSGGGSDGGGQTTETACTDPPKPATDPGDAICSVEKDGEELLIIGDVLLPGSVQKGAGVLLDKDGKIKCVGCDCHKQATAAKWVICPNAVVSPGLIDAHNHVGWLNGKPWVAKLAKVDPAVRWEHRHDWRKGLRGNPKVNVPGGGASTDQKALGELRYVLTGSTAIFGSGDLSGLMRDLDSTGKGDNGLGQPGAKYDTFPLGDSSGTMKSKGCSYPKIAFPPGKSTDAYGPHVAEGIDDEARNEFLCMTGQGDGAAELLDNRAALIHAVGLSVADYGFMASKGMKMIWSPRSNVSLYGETARVVLAAKMGVTIGLGGDWVPSGSINMLRELQCAAYLNDNHYNKFFSDEQLWRMATLNAARALAMDDAVGSLKVGLAGDIAVFAKSTSQGHAAVINAKTKDVALVLRGGVVLAGNNAVVSALEPSCESLGDVCGVEKAVCVKKSIGKTYKDLTDGTKPGYPLWFCDTPDDEPSCVPARMLKEDSVDGSNTYAGKSDPKDTDGDGIANEEDNCPTLFNPMRPMDHGKQRDTDSDGKGDVCDPCPLDADTDTCKKFDADDPDGDGRKLGEDNCPQIGNADQADKDKDGKGDVCDPCPDYANPGAGGCLQEVTDLKTKADLMGARVAVKGLVVTAAANKGFFAQKAGEPIDNGGIFAYMGDNPLPKVGAIIDITGATLGTFFGQKQLTSVTFEDTGATETPKARKLGPEALKKMVADKHDSVHDELLIEVVDVAVTDDKPAAGPGDPDGKNEFEIAGGVRVDDGMWPADTDFIKPFPKKGQILAKVVGPVAFRNENMKILPRGVEDVTLGPPEVLSVTPDKAFQYVGKKGPTVPAPITITLDHPGEADVELDVTVGDDTVATVAGPFVIAKGKDTLELDVEGLKVGTTTLTVKAKNGKAEKQIAIGVLEPNAVPAVAAITPSSGKIASDTTQKLTVSLAVPAGKDGVKVTLTLDPVDAGTLPAEVTVTAGAVSADVLFKAGSKTGPATITAATDSGKAMSKLEIVDPATLTLDLSGWTLTQTSSAKTWKIADGTKIPVGGFLVIARKASKADFEKQWGVTLGSNVVYVNSSDKFPSINGDETFTIKDAKGATVDGPTIKLKTGSNANFQRKAPVGPAGDDASWTAGKVAPGGPNPGTFVGDIGASPGLFISEFSDATGSGKFVFEFVELYYPGPK